MNLVSRNKVKQWSLHYVLLINVVLLKNNLNNGPNILPHCNPRLSITVALAIESSIGGVSKMKTTTT